MGTLICVNLGGEGEEPGILNQQPPFALSPSWRSQSRETLAQLVARGIPFVVALNDRLPFADNTFDVVYSNNVPVDSVHRFFGVGVQTREVKRILKSGGGWIRDRVLVYTKP